MATALENSMVKTAKGTIPVTSFKPIKGEGFESLEAAKYETYDLVVKADQIQLAQSGIVRVGGYDDTFSLTSFAATGFAWCSLTEDRKCETEEAARLITEGFQSQSKEYRLRITENGVIIAIVSPIYVPLQNSIVVDGVLAQRGSFDAASYWSLHPEDTRIALQTKKKFKHKGEEFSGGALVVNGEHGKQAFTAMGRMVQWICANGMTVGFGQSVDINKKHKGENDWSNFDVGTSIEDVVSKSMFLGNFVEHMEALWIKNQKQREDILKRVVQTEQFGPAQAKAFAETYDYQRNLRNRKTETMYDVFNAVTGMKDKFPKTRMHWEELGGKLLLDPDKYHVNAN